MRLPVPLDYEKRIAELEAENAALKKDAERYRWLRPLFSTKDIPILQGRGMRIEPDEIESIDAAIDAAMKEQS